MQESTLPTYREGKDYIHKVNNDIAQIVLLEGNRVYYWIRQSYRPDNYKPGKLFLSLREFKKQFKPAKSDPVIPNYKQ